MATLPQAADYGARVQLRSNRIDIPGQGELAVADALSRAAATFTNMAIEHKQKDDALSYAHAKNEYLIADIQERDKLADDQDFATQTERYNEAMKGHYERLFPTVRSQRDRGLFDAEARLMNARGQVAVGDMARTREIDWNVAELGRHGRELQGSILAASDAQTAQDGMFSYLEHINSLLTKGFITESQHETWSKDFVTTVSGKRLLAMDPKMREVLLERSITMAKSQGRITRDQVFAGEGSGSIADFIPLDERVKMLEATRKGNEHDAVMTEANAIFDGIRDTYTDPKKVNDEVRRLSRGLDHEVRTALKVLSNDYQVTESRLEGMGRTTVMRGASGLLDQGINPEVAMAGEQWGSLLQVQKDSLRAAWISRQQRDGFGEVDVLYTEPKTGADAHLIGDDGQIMLGETSQAPSYSLWTGMSAAERAKVDLDDETWRQAFTYGTWTDFKREQKGIRDAQDIAGAKPPTESPGLTPMQRVNSSLVTMEKIPATARTPEDERKYWSAVRALDRQIRIAEGIKGEKLTADEEATIWTDMLKDAAFTDHYWWDPDTDEEDKQLIVTMDPETLNRAREPFIGSSTVHGGQKMTHRQKIEQMAVDIGLVADDVAERDLERANFALVNLVGTDGNRYNIYTITEAQMEDVNDEIERRLGGT